MYNFYSRGRITEKKSQVIGLQTIVSTMLNIVLRGFFSRNRPQYYTFNVTKQVVPTLLLSKR